MPANCCLVTILDCTPMPESLLAFQSVCKRLKQQKQPAFMCGVDAATTLSFSSREPRLFYNAYEFLSLEHDLPHEKEMYATVIYIHRGRVLEPTHTPALQAA